MHSDFINSDLFTWVILPFLIFVSRVMDVSIGTLRLIFVSKGFKYLAPLLGFFEVIIWLLAIGQIMQNLSNIMCYVAYGLGFATGNYVGIVLDERLSIGTVLVRVIPNLSTEDLVKKLRSSNFGVTTVEVEGMKGRVKMLMSIINRKDAKAFVKIVNENNPKAFYTIESVSAVNEGYLPAHNKSGVFSARQLLRRRGK